MKNLKWILIPLCLFTFLSCGKKQENDDGLAFTTSSKIILLDADIYSCDDITNNSTTPSLKAVSGKTSSLKIKWAGDNPIEIQKVELNIKSTYLSGGEFGITQVYEGLTYGGGDPDTTHVESCGIRIGGIPLKDKNRSAFMTGTITMTGVTSDAEDNTSAVKATYDVDLQYDP